MSTKSGARLSSGHETVDRVYYLFKQDLIYDRIPLSWDLHMLREDKRAASGYVIDFFAQRLLSHFLSWYRPKIHRDDQGRDVGLSKKFGGDLYNIRVSRLMNRFSVSDTTMRQCIVRLENYGLIRREQRDIESNSNVLHIDLNMDEIERITYAAQVNTQTGNLEKISAPAATAAHPLLQSRQTYTQIYRFSSPPASGQSSTQHSSLPGAPAPSSPPSHVAASREFQRAQGLTSANVGKDASPSMAGDGVCLEHPIGSPHVQVSSGASFSPDVFSSSEPESAQDAAARGRTLDALTQLVAQEFAEWASWIGEKKRKEAIRGGTKDVDESVRHAKNKVLAELLRILFPTQTGKASMRKIRAAVVQVERDHPEADPHIACIQTLLTLHGCYLPASLGHEQETPDPALLLEVVTGDPDALAVATGQRELPGHLLKHVGARRPPEERMHALRHALKVRYLRQMETPRSPVAKLARLWEKTWGLPYGDPSIHLAGLFIKHTKRHAAEDPYALLTRATVHAIGSNEPLEALAHELHYQLLKEGYLQRTEAALQKDLRDLLQWGLSARDRLTIHLSGAIRTQVENLIEALST